MTNILNNEEFYTLNVNGEEKTLPKMAVLNRGLTRLNLSQDGVNAFNYETLSASYEGDNLPTEDVLKAKGVTLQRSFYKLIHKEKYQTRQCKAFLDSDY